MGSVLPGYRWRKPIIANYTPDGAQTSYQMKLAIAKGSGIEAAGTTYLGDLSLNWPYDIAITQLDGITPVNYWREEYDATDGSWWIKTPYIPAASPFFGWMYFGCPGGVDLSSLSNTFGAGMADDFEWGINGTDITTSGGNVTWSKIVGGTSTCLISTAQAYLGTRSAQVHRDNANNAYFYCVRPAVANIAIRWAIYKLDAALMTVYHGKTGGTKVVQLVWSNDEVVYSPAGTSCGFSVTADAWHVFEICNFNWTAYTYDIYVDGVLKKSSAAMLTSGGGSDTWYLGIENANNTEIYGDNFIVRNWTANEPTWAIAGRTEACGNRIFAFRREHMQRVKFHRKLNLK